MNRLDLEKFGVQELDSEETISIVGGNSWLRGLTDFAALYDAVTDGVSGFVDGLRDGFKAGMAK